MPDASDRLRTAILTLTAQRAPKSICPSDAARAVDAGNWRTLMDDARAAACELARAGDVVITQKGAVLDPDTDWRGPVRITARIDKL